MMLNLSIPCISVFQQTSSESHLYSVSNNPINSLVFLHKQFFPNTSYAPCHLAVYM